MTLAQETTSENAAEADEAPGGGIASPQMFYHARSTSFNRNLDRTIFEGDVVAIGGGTIITADRIEVDNKHQALSASGHVIILTPSQVFLGKEMIFYWETGDFRISDALMVANDPKQVQQVSNKVLGFSPEEVVFEAKRRERLAYLDKRKLDLRQDFRKNSGKKDENRDQLIDQYALVLEQEDLTRYQENPALSKMSGERRENFLKRRKYWEESLKTVAAPSGAAGSIYFRIKGEEIERTNGNDFKAVEASWSPCKCDEDESPAWGFSSDRIEAQMEGYVDLVHPVLQIKGIPIFYLPYLKIPIKDRRQSGFLVPTIRTESDTGTVYTQPVYFAVAPNFDTTVTTDVFQDRGTRLGIEGRYQQRKHSGWTLNLETMRDRVWIDERNVRERLVKSHTDDFDGCTRLPPNDPGYCEPDYLTRKLAVPYNTWRGKQEWRGQTFLAPRLSLVSHGTIYSDHRYVDDLYLGDSFEAAFQPAVYANAFSTAKGRLHLDSRDFYLGLGSSFGDFARMDGRFDGLQMPGFLRVQSRVHDLLPPTSPIPLYASLAVDDIPIKNFSGKEDPDQPILGTGEWRRVHANLTSPLVTEGVVRVDTFIDAENRSIRHTPLPTVPGDPASAVGTKSWIQSWRTGLTFNLPIDGKGEMPEMFQPSDAEELEKGRRYLHHIMNWSIGLSARPVVVRRGAYGEVDPATGLRHVYFASDRKVYDSNDSAAIVEESMLKHQRITFGTTHRWKTYRQGWRVLEGGKPAQNLKEDETYRTKARRELEYSMDRQIHSDREMFSEESGLNWYINRYQLQEYDSQEPVNFGASITFDFIQERIRQDQIKENRRLEALALAAASEAEAASYRDQVIPYPNLAKSWSGPYTYVSVNWAGFTLSNQIDYDLYLRTSNRIIFGLGLPEFFATRFGGNYTLEKTSTWDVETDTHIFKLTKISALAITSRLIPYVNTSISLAKRTTEGEKDQFETRIGLEYYDSSECWGLRFLRSKDFEVQHDRQASYLLQLTVIFLGQQRGVDMSAPVAKRFHEE